MQSLVNAGGVEMVEATIALGADQARLANGGPVKLLDTRTSAGSSWPSCPSRRTTSRGWSSSPATGRSTTSWRDRSSKE